MEKRFCNLCGNTLDEWDNLADFGLYKKHIPYGSVHDGDTVELHLCCGCFDRLVGMCTVNPIIERGEISFG